MSWHKHEEEQTQCSFSEECENVADCSAVNYQTGSRAPVCLEHKEELEVWLAENYF